MERLVLVEFGVQPVSYTHLVALKMGDAVKEYTVTATNADGYKSATLSRENDPYYWTSREMCIRDR